MVRPGTEHYGAALLVEWIVGDVDFTYGLEDASRLPVYAAVVCDDGSELTELLVNVFCAGGSLRGGA